MIQISKGLSKFKEVSEVIKFTTRTVPHVMKFTHGAFYYYDDQFEKYSIKSQFGYEGAVPEIFKESKLINFIAESEKVLLVEEQSQKITLPEWHDFVSKTSAECVVPVSHDKKLLGFLLLGKKKNNQMFTHDDVSMFEIFRDHLAVTIENCHFLERERKRTEEDGVHARRQQMDMMFHTLTHELDNPNAGILGSAELLLDNFSHYTDLNVPQCKAEFDHYLPEIIHNSKRLSKILRAFESYVKGNHEYKVVSPNEIYEEFQTLLNVLVKKARKQENNNVVITEEIEPNLPLINVVAVTIEEILMNFIENSIDAVKFNKDDKGKLITVKIFKYNARYVRFFVSDNGHGVFMDDIKETLFEVPTTSKGSSEGTGLGCYRVRKICEINNGKPGFFSEGKGLGAEFWVDIPIYDNPQPGELK